ncbi:hypothetical protein HPY42_01455 [Coprothermobacteraceae bacterium]|nr:hypothetical protein [Coprothermobacteraceae bacterium]
MSSKDSHSRSKNRPKQDAEVGFWFRALTIIGIVVVVFFLSYGHVATYLTQAPAIPRNYALNLKLLSDMETAEDGNVFSNVDRENPCTRFSYVVLRDNLRSWFLFQGGMPSQLGVVYTLESMDALTSSAAWVYVPMQFSSVRGSVDVEACALGHATGIRDTMVTSVAAAKVATFRGVVEERGGAVSAILNAPPMLEVHVDKTASPTVSITVTATDGPYTKVDKVVVSLLVPQPNGTFKEEVLYPAKEYTGPVTVTVHLEPGTYQLVAGAVDNYNNFADVTQSITVK